MPPNEDETPSPAPHAVVGAATERIAEVAARLASEPTHHVEAGTALEHAHDQVEFLKEGLRTRTVIGEAVGLLMARFEMTSDEAFAHLVRKSSVTNRKVRLLADEMVAEADAAARSAGGVPRSVRLD